MLHLCVCLVIVDLCCCVVFVLHVLCFVVPCRCVNVTWLLLALLCCCCCCCCWCWCWCCCCWYVCMLISQAWQDTKHASIQQWFAHAGASFLDGPRCAKACCRTRVRRVVAMETLRRSRWMARAILHVLRRDFGLRSGLEAFEFKAPSHST